MGLRSYLTKAFSRVPFLHGAISVFDRGGMYGSKPKPFNTDVATRQYHSWVYAAINIRAKAVSNIPLRLYVKRSNRKFKEYQTRSLDDQKAKSNPVLQRRFNYLIGESRSQPSQTVRTKVAQWGGEFEEVIEPHPVLQVLAKPSVGHCGFNLTLARLIDLYLTGNWYMHPIISPVSGIPAELWHMPSWWTFICPSRTNYIEGFAFGQYTMDMTVFKPEEVIHGKFHNPRDFFYGLGCIEAAWGPIGLLNAKQEMDLAYADNYGRPDYMVIVKNAIGGDKNLQRYAQEIEKQHRGRHKTGRFGVVGGDVEFKEFSGAPRELGDTTRVIEAIAAALAVPVQMIMGGSDKLADSRAGHVSFLRDTVGPDCRMDEEILNQQYLPLFREAMQDQGMFLAYDDALPSDKAFDLKERVLATRFYLTQNEARSQVGLDPHPDGNKLPKIGGGKGDGMGDKEESAISNDGADGQAESEDREDDIVKRI